MRALQRWFYLPSMPVSPLSSILEAETHLVQRLYVRDEAAMTVFCDRYRVILYRVLRALRPTAEAAEDVLQESLLKIWQSFAHYDAGRGRLYTWAVNVCRHQAIDHLRRTRTRGAGRTSPLEQNPVAQQRPAPAWLPEHLDLRASLHWLRPAYQRVLDLQYFEGLTHEEIAQQLRMPLGTVKTHCRQGLRQLALLHRDRDACPSI